MTSIMLLDVMLHDPRQMLLMKINNKKDLYQFVLIKVPILTIQWQTNIKNTSFPGRVLFYVKFSGRNSPTAYRMQHMISYVSYHQYQII